MLKKVLLFPNNKIQTKFGDDLGLDCLKKKNVDKEELPSIG